MNTFRNLIAGGMLAVLSATTASAASFTLPTLASGGAVSAGDLLLSRQGADTVDKKITAAQLKTFANAGLSLGSLSDVVKNDGSNNLALGTGAGGALTTGTNNTALGYPALSANTSGGWNVAIGSNSLIANTTATDGVAVGDSALNANTTGWENTAVGSGALEANVTGVQNTAIGAFALYPSTGSYLTAVGDGALNSCTTCPNSVAVGYGVAHALTTGGFNTAVGYTALLADITGHDNTAMGNIALLSTTGNTSTGIGAGALWAATTGSANTSLGYLAGAAVTTGSNNVIIGSGADVSAGAAANRIAIGQGVTNSTDNTVSIGNSSITDVHFGNDTAKLHADGSLLTSTATSLTAGSVALSKLATQATNTILGNATSGTASPTALAIGTCSTAGSALNWTTNTGFGCNTSITAATMPASGLTGTIPAANNETNLRHTSIGATFNGGGSAIAANSKQWVYVPYGTTIQSSTIACDQSGSIAFDVQMDTYANFSTAMTSIVASAPPTVTSAQKAQDLTLTGWTTAIPAGDYILFKVTSATTVTNCNIVLDTVRT